MITNLTIRIPMDFTCSRRAARAGQIPLSGRCHAIEKNVVG